MSWNINGVRTILEKQSVQNFLMNYGIVCMNKVKTSLRVSLPGYASFMSNNKRSPHRGGTVVMVRNYLAQSVMNVDTNTMDQRWLQFRCVPGVVFRCCYVPPSDSPYFSHNSFVSIHDKILANLGNNKYVIIGDCNARFGNIVKELPARTELPNCDEYLLPSHTRPS